MGSVVKLDILALLVSTERGILVIIQKPFLQAQNCEFY